MKIKKVLVSQPKPASEKSPYYDIAEKYGVKIDFRPFIKVESLSAKEFRQQKVSILDHTAVIFTSRHAIDHFFNLCTELRVTIPETMKYFCVTEAVALYIQKYVQYRKRKIFFGATGKIEDLVPSIVKHKTEKYLVPMSDVHNDDVKNLLDKNNIQHTEAVMYRTVSNDFTPDEEGPLGAKEAGEGSAAPVVPAIANAVNMATGVYFTELPLDPEHIWRALHGMKDDRNSK